MIETYKYLFIFNILIIVLLVIKPIRVHMTVSDVLQILKIENYKIQDYLLLFTLYFIAMPIGIITLILISFKIYTHDFVKPIQKSYLAAVIYHLSSILYTFYIVDILLISADKFFLYKISKNENYLYTFSIFSKLSALVLNLVVFIITLLFLEINIAFRLNSIPITSFHLLDKNRKSLIIVFCILMLYLLIYGRILINMYVYLKSLKKFLLMINISMASACCTNMIFYIIYFNYISEYIATHSRLYREFVE